MADTRQIVQWSIEQSCRLRATEKAKFKPSEAIDSVLTARACSHGMKTRANGFGVFGDIYVSSCTFACVTGEKAKCKRGLSYPSSGVIISKEFSKYGGINALFEMCNACPASTRFDELASCVGDIYQLPESSETEAQLRAIISRLGLEKQMAECFPATRPLWHGLWAVTPVPSKSLPALRLILAEMLAEDTRDMEATGKTDMDQIRQFSNLVAAVELAEANGLKLHVDLMPPGHTDFGVYTTFPHCPFCKAAARVERWQRRYQSENQTCHVCGTRFSPAETAAVERMEWDRPELRDLLGEQEFRKFAAEYLMELGETAESAAEIVEATEKAEVEREEKNRRNAELENRKRQYLEAHIYVGLQSLPPPEFSISAEDENEATSGTTGWFNAADLTKVLQRCAAQNIKVTMLQHHSDDGESDRFEMRNLKDPVGLLTKWQAEGCHEKFYASCRVPNSLVD